MLNTVNIPIVISALIIFNSYLSSANYYNMLNLPQSHLPFYFNKYPEVAQECKNDKYCIYNNMISQTNIKKSCWGYEEWCRKENSYSAPICPGNHTGYVRDKQSQIDTFYTQADFGYVKQQLRELSVMCEPLFIDDSSLECSKYLRFCNGRNIMLNFTDLSQRHDRIRYDMDVLTQGQISGHCKFYKERLDAELEHLSPLQSWAPEMRNFQTISEKPITDNLCDLVIDKPTIIMKIDATINLYHHFCDFFNLYISLHVNSTHPSAFSTDVNIFIWESYTYYSPFAETFQVYTDYPLLNLNTFSGKTVCFKNIVFALLPRMIFGLYYNTPIIQGCERSGMFRAFSEHILHRLRIPLFQRNIKKIKITFLSRNTKYRNVLNENELIDVLSKDDRFIIQKVSYDSKIKFSDQLVITHNTDILIGMHGAGLTHLLFLPNWAAIFELYNCEDPSCYKDLARLRGLYYITWENKSMLFQEDAGQHPDGGVHAKFTNYAFDVGEFSRLVDKAAKYVTNHDEFRNFINNENNLSIDNRDEL